MLESKSKIPLTVCVPSTLQVQSGDPDVRHRSHQRPVPQNPRGQTPGEQTLSLSLLKGPFTVGHAVIHMITKDNNYINKDIVLKIVHTTSIMITAERNDVVGITFRTIFPADNDKKH